MDEGDELDAEGGKGRGYAGDIAAWLARGMQPTGGLQEATERPGGTSSRIVEWSMVCEGELSSIGIGEPPLPISTGADLLPLFAVSFTAVLG